VAALRRPRDAASGAIDAAIKGQPGRNPRYARAPSRGEGGWEMGRGEGGTKESRRT